jgi:hypothetical protein
MAVIFVATSPASAQTPPTAAPSADSLAAARELVEAMKAADQFKAILPIVLQNLKMTVVQNRPETDKRFEAMIPTITATVNEHINDLIAQMAEVYARHFSADEIRQMTAFYRTPTGQKLIAQQPDIAREVMSTGQQFGRALTTDLQTRTSDELRKRGNGN